MNNFDKNKRKRVLVAMSGGIDSSIAAWLLQQNGYQVIGLTLETFSFNKNLYRQNYNSSIIDAREIALKLKIPHYVLDVKNNFQKIVIDYFTNEYLQGRTPNPCVVCNPQLKWTELLNFADKLNCGFIATGHYANIKFENNRYVLYKSIDNYKDQTFFLWRLTQEQLKRTIFPLGDKTKPEIRDLAQKIGFNLVNSKRESYNLCFLQNSDYRSFFDDLLNNNKIHYNGGFFRNSKNEVIGKHNGITHYTIGQKIILGNKSFFVKEIKNKTYDIILDDKYSTGTKIIKINNINAIKYDSIPENTQLLAKTTYKNPLTICEIQNKENHQLVKFKTEVFALSSGQSIIFYENDDVIGGGIIV